MPSESKPLWLTPLVVVLLVATTALAGCLGGDDEIACGEDTELVDGKCVAKGKGGGGNVVEVSILARQWSFEPDEIVVTEGDTVILTFTSTMDTQSQYAAHTFTLNAYDLAVDLPVGETVTVEFVADQVGEFTFECSVFCGDRHNDMLGTLVVKPQQAGTEVEVPQIGNHTALDISTEIFVNGGVPDWNNLDLMLVVERENESVAFVDTSRDLIVGRIHGLGFQPHTVVFDEEARYGYLVSRGGWLSKIDLDDLSVPKYVKVGESSRGTALSANGKWIATSNYDPSSFVIVNTETMEVAMEYRIPIPWVDGEPQFSRVASLLDTPDGYIFAAMKDLGEVWVIDVDETRWTDSPFPVVKVFNEQGGLLHDAYITPDGHYYVLASQTSHHMVVIDVWNLTEVGLIDTGLKPHPGPGAVWGDYIFTPSIGEGKLNIINTTSWVNEFTVAVGGPALFTRTYKFGDPLSVEGWEKDPDQLRYPYVWWDTVLAADDESTPDVDEFEMNQEVYVLDLRLLYDSGTTNETLAAATHVLKYNQTSGRTLHPEFSRDGTKVYVSNWEQNGSLLVYEAFPDSGLPTYNGSANDPATFDLIGIIEGLTTPTGTFQVGVRAEEIGV